MTLSVQNYLALLAAGCACLLAELGFGAAPKAPSTVEEMVRQRMERVIIPRLEFRDATVREALDFLKKKSVELDLKAPVNLRTNFPLVLDGPGEASPATPLQGVPTESGATLAPLPGLNTTKTPDARITLALTNVSLYEALRYVTSLADLKLRIRPGGIDIMPASDPDPINSGSEKPATVSPGAKDKTPSKAEAARRLASQIILPEVKLDDVSFTGAVREIQKLAALQDRRGRTFSMVIIGAPHPAADGQSSPISPAIVPGIPGLENRPALNPTDAPDSPQISCTARNLSMWSALEAIARLAHYEVAMDEYAVVFKKPDSATTNPAKDAPTDATESRTQEGTKK